MAEEGKRIEFEDNGPYLFQLLDVEPEAMLLEEHEVCLLQFGGLYVPVSLNVCPDIAATLVNMSEAAMGPERTGMVPLEFDLEETTELPLVTGCEAASFQHNDTVYMDVLFDQTAGRLCFSVRTAAAVGQLVSLVDSNK